jgi:dihydroorotate dehydrogenase (NAD+) catalytic subunit
VRAFVEEDLPRLAGAGVPVIGSVAGSTADEYLRVAQVLHVQPGIVALEIYLSCPDQERHGAPFYARPDRVAEIVGAVARLSRLPVFAKLPPLLPDLASTARAAVRAGAHGLTLIDALPGLSVDVDSRRPRLAAPVGLLSGPAIRPVAVAAVYRVAQELPETPIMGVGGIRTPADAIEFFLAGAWAVQIGTALLVDPSVHLEVAKGILAYLKDKGIGSPADLRGRLRPRGGVSAERA